MADSGLSFLPPEIEFGCIENRESDYVPQHKSEDRMEMGGDRSSVFRRVVGFWRSFSL